MTRLGMVFLGLMATAAAIAVGVAVVTDNSQEAKPLPLTPAQIAELKPANEAPKVRPPPPTRHDEDDAGPDATPQDGDGEDGPGS
jgi:hypothetical protein